MRRRKLVAILVLVLALPAYVLVAAMAVSLLDRPHPAVEALVYLGLGIAWALPLRRLFLGLGRAAPGSERQDPPRRRR